MWIFGWQHCNFFFFELWHVRQNFPCHQIIEFNSWITGKRKFLHEWSLSCQVLRHGFGRHAIGRWTAGLKLDFSRYQGPGGLSVGLRPLSCWYCEFESLRRHRCLCSECWLCLVGQRSLRPTDCSTRGVVRSVVCLSVISKPRQRGDLGPRILSSYGKKSSILVEAYFPYRNGKVNWN
jgi:hypothetical protein